MKYVFRRTALSALAVGIGLTGCTDEARGPLSVSPGDTPFFFQQAAPGVVVEEIWLADELEDKDVGLAPEWNGSKIFKVDLDDATNRANLTLRADLSVANCATLLPAGVDCRVAFDKVHISASPDGKRIYAVNRQKPPAGPYNSRYSATDPARTGDAPNTGIKEVIPNGYAYTGLPMGYYDVDANSFVWMGEFTGLPTSGGFVLATNSANGNLYVGSAQTNSIYRILAADLANNDLALKSGNSWPVVLEENTSVALDLVGADMAFDAQGRLFVWTNTGTNSQRGLYRVVLDGGSPEKAVATRIGGSSTAYFTGLAFRDAGNGPLLGSTAVISNENLTDDSRIYVIDPATGECCSIQVFDMYLNNVRYEHLYGDMTTGRLVTPPPAGAVLLIIDEDGIDNGLHVNKSGGWITPSGPQFWTEKEVNDDLAAYGFRNVLRYFAASSNFGKTITVRTGQTGDEGWFAPNCIPRKWLNSSTRSSDITCLEGAERTTGINNLFFSGKTPFAGAPSSWNIPQSRLDKIPQVRPLRALGIQTLVGQDVCALVYDSDISINYDHGKALEVNGNLQGATLGIAAFKVESAHTLDRFSSSTLPQVKITVLDPAVACKNFRLYDAPVPNSSSEPNDRVIPSTVGVGPKLYRSIATNPFN